MKVTLHIPTEQYGFVEVETEAETVEDAKALYPTSGEGLGDKEYDAFIQRMIKGEANHTNDLERLSQEQYKYMKVVDRAISRINYQLRKEKGEEFISTLKK